MAIGKEEAPPAGIGRFGSRGRLFLELAVLTLVLAGFLVWKAEDKDFALRLIAILLVIMACFGIFLWGRMTYVVDERGIRTRPWFLSTLVPWEDVTAVTGAEVLPIDDGSRRSSDPMLLLKRAYLGTGEERGTRGSCWLVTDHNGRILFRIGLFTRSAPRLVELIRNRIASRPHEKVPESPRVQKRMQEIYPGASAARPSDLRCVRCSAQVERSKLLATGAMRIDDETCVCGDCMEHSD